MAVPVGAACDVRVCDSVNTDDGNDVILAKVVVDIVVGTDAVIDGVEVGVIVVDRAPSKIVRAFADDIVRCAVMLVV